MSSYVIDVVESSPSTLERIRFALRSTKFRLREFTDGREFLYTFQCNPPDLILLDLHVGSERGLSLLKHVRDAGGEKRDTRVLMLGEESTLEERCSAYLSGADGFLSIPFDDKELLAIVIANMRRVRKRKEVIRFGPFVLDKIEREARKNNQLLNLTNCEFLIYQVLMEAQGGIVSREALYRAFGDPRKPYDPRSKALDMHIKSLRNKLGEEGRFIENVYGGGYRLVESVPDRRL